MNKIFNGLDQVVAGAINGVSNLTAPAKAVEHAIKQGTPAPDTEKIPSPFEKVKVVAQSVRDLAINYHLGINKHIHEWSTGIQEALKKLLSRILSPICFFRTGKAFQKIFSDNVALTAYFTSFIALHVMHVFPYAMIAGATTGAIFLYHTTPVALISFIGGSILLVQLFLSYQMAVGVDRANKRLEEEAKEFKNQFQKQGDEIAKNVNVQQLAYNFSRSPKSWLFVGTFFLAIKIYNKYF